MFIPDHSVSQPPSPQLTTATQILVRNILQKEKNNNNNLLIKNIIQNKALTIIFKLEKPSTNIKYTKEFLEDEREQILDEKIGFTHVVRKILEVGEPIVGHNLVLDLLHMIEKMVQPLPEKLEQFKSLVKCNIPTVYDTKLLAKDPPFCVDIPVTSLGAVYSDVCSKFNPPHLVIEEGYESYETGSNSKAHDAGFDAFITGVCFVTMVKKLDGSNWKNKSVVKSKHLDMYANRVNNMSSHDIPFLNLVGPDVQPDRSKIFCAECPSSWTTMHVHGLFHMIKPLKIVWVSSTFLYVIPLEDMDKKVCRQHLKNVNASCPPLVRVRLYGDTISSKRKSATDEEVSPIQIRASRIHEFKRLKSVGSDQLSKMTLESPSAEEPPSVISGDNGKKAAPKQGKATQDVFSIPDEW
nr:poly(A)-specific ribonuclease PARN-like [Procambarus clarkii]